MKQGKHVLMSRELSVKSRVLHQQPRAERNEHKDQSTFSKQKHFKELSFLSNYWKLTLQIYLITCP